MKRRLSAAVVAIVVAATVGLSSETGVAEQKKKALDQWTYHVVTHSQYLKEGGSDLRRFNALGKEGGELASSYPIKGELIVSVFKRPR